jgi:hypothetical protein
VKNFRAIGFTEFEVGIKSRFHMCYEIIDGRAWSEENKLLASLLVPEQIPWQCRNTGKLSLEESQNNYLLFQAERAAGLSQVNQQLHLQHFTICVQSSLTTVILFLQHFRKSWERNLSSKYLTSLCEQGSFTFEKKVFSLPQCSFH